MKLSDWIEALSSMQDRLGDIEPKIEVWADNEAADRFVLREVQVCNSTMTLRISHVSSGADRLRRIA